MKYSEIVEDWAKESDAFFNYRFKVAENFFGIYHYIAKELGIDNESGLNKKLEVFPLNEKDEKIILHSSYSMVGAVVYEKRGWASIGLRLLVDKNIANKLNCSEGEYRFSFYIKPEAGTWYFFIDEYYYQDNLKDNVFIYSEKELKNSLCNSSQKDFKKTVMEYILTHIPKKINWNSNYKEELIEQFNNIYKIIQNELEIKESYLDFYPRKIDTQKETTKFKLEDCLQYEINDWCSVKFKLLLERAPNIYPKKNFLYSFYIKYDLENKKWLFSMNERFYSNEFQNELNIESSECKTKINDLFAKITLESASFNRWLEDDYDFI